MSRKVLVVDDDADVRGMFRRALPEDDEVMEAASAEEALAKLEADARVDAIFSDYHMRGAMTGLVFLSEVRRRWPHIALIFMSGDAIGSDQCPDKTTVIRKPFDTGEIPTILEGAIQHQAK